MALCGDSFRGNAIIREFDIREGFVTINDLKDFDEVFLTNAIFGIRWVRQFENKIYQNTQTEKIYEQFVRPFHSK